MALSIDLSPLARTVHAIAGEATTTQWALQLAVAAAGILAAWAAARFACTHVRTSEKWKFGKGAFEKVVFPLLAFVLVWIGKDVLARFQDVGFLEVVLTLLATLAATRIAAYVLGHVLPEGGMQRAVIRALQWAAWIAAVLYVTGLLPEVASTLESHGFTFAKDKHPVTILDLLKGAAALFLSVTLALYLSRVTEGRVLAAESIEMTTRVVIAKVVRIAMLFVMVFVALPMAGIDVTTLSVFTGALGVGLGFGLQKITSNYVSGFIVLLDRSLRIGDVVTVDGRRGEVTAIETRYTVIKGSDGVESIIPNEKMITETVNHHTYSDPKVSIAMPVTVSYESDVERACAILGEVARRQPRVIAEPPAMARVKQLSDHGVELELTVWISDPAVGEGDMKSELLKAVLKAFRAEGVEIPYPRREVRMIATGEITEIATIPRA
ncbi:MAG: mechanosensitive ion channel family protein [Usitatibacter sp.]